ncbi:MAG: cupredoxin domain-containing protein, partial [Patescibacteria group bacterium]
PANVARPDVSIPLGASTDDKLRKFQIQITGGAFAPEDTVVVRKGDSVRLAVTAVDRNYDFTQPDYGFSSPIRKGTSVEFKFAATASGKFTFFCKSCGGPEKGPVGYLIVAE